MATKPDDVIVSSLAPRAAGETCGVFSEADASVIGSALAEHKLSPETHDMLFALVLGAGGSSAFRAYLTGERDSPHDASASFVGEPAVFHWCALPF